MASSMSPRGKSIEREVEYGVKDEKALGAGVNVHSVLDDKKRAGGLSMSPSRSTQPRRSTATARSPVSVPPSKTSLSSFSQSTPSPPSSSSTPSASHSSTTSTSTSTIISQHPLAQPPINAHAPSHSATSPPAPLPFLSLAPAQVNSLRAGLVRRRSSYPPASAPGSGSASNAFPWVMGGTPGAGGFDWGAAFDSFPGFGSELGPAEGPGSGQTPGTVAWDTLLDFDVDHKVTAAGKMVSSNLATAQPIVNPTEPQSNHPSVARARSDPLSDSDAMPPTTDSAGQYTVDAPTPTTLQPAPGQSSPARVIQFGADLAWRTALASVVEVEGVGSITVARVLQEVWRRGGGELVTSQCLWPSIVIALAMPVDAGPDVRVPNPSAQSSMALQQLYNLSIRHWEPAIFTGLLGAYAAAANPPPASSTTEAAPQSVVNAFAPIPHYGPSTPLREPDVSQWMNLTPSGWSFLPNDVTLLNGAADDKPIQSDSFSIPGFPFPVHADLMEEAGINRRTSLSRTDGGDDSHIKGIDEILASMEEGKEERERAIIAATLASESHSFQPPQPSHDTPINPPPNAQNATFQFPTPETDRSNSPSRRNSKTGNALSPESIGSPYVSTSSSSVIAPTPTASTSQPQSQSQSQLQSQIPAQRPASNKPRPSQQLLMPPVEFIPPPPMCMFFNPSFENLTDGKAGIWRGDLEVRGKGGGKFPIIVVGEKDTEHLWQSHLWPQTLTYPLNPVPVESCTSTMIPVSHLAREGLIPITMGMVLCNEPPERLAPYVNMVQGLHAEGVGFHLPCETRLPIVFLPAKFHSSDPLLRLGIAFMGKAGYPHPVAPLPSGSTIQVSSNRGRVRGPGASDGNEDGPKKKKRRQSAPAAPGVTRGPRKKESTSARIEEETE